MIVQGVRTAIGRYGGGLKELNSGHLAAHVIAEVLNRSSVSPEMVDEVIMGEVRQTTESSNVARVAGLRAEIPVTTPAFTVNRLCASGMQAIASGVQQIQSEQVEIVVAGGTESMSNSPIYLRNSRFGGDNAHLVDSNTEVGQQPTEIYGNELGMGMTAEHVAERFGISREAQDVFAIDSQMRAKVAMETGKFKEEIAPIVIKTKKEIFTVEEDEHPRPQMTIEKLQELKPVFKQSGTVTAGNTCGRNDGAAAVLLMTKEKAEKLEVEPIAAVIDWATVGVDPKVMGIGPVPAIKKLLARTALTLADIDRFEINEAFAAQAVAVQQELGIDSKKLNVNGGAIALGHPVGATGTRIVITLMYELKRSNKRFGIASLCVGGGQGMAILIENLQCTE